MDMTYWGRQRNKYKVCKIHGDKKLKYRYLDDKFEVYTHLK